MAADRIWRGVYESDAQTATGQCDTSSSEAEAQSPRWCLVISTRAQRSVPSMTVA